jgi:hypothetical protein
MTKKNTISAHFWDESAGQCDCCGHESRTIWGELSDSSGTKALYFVQWTTDRPAHFPNIDLVLGPWGKGSSPGDRVLVSLVYKPRPGGGSFTVTSGAGRRADSRGICGRALERAEVIGTPLAQEAFALVDALWLTEPRIGAMLELDGLAHDRLTARP